MGPRAGATGRRSTRHYAPSTRSTPNQLKAFKDGTRKSASSDIMQVVTERMTDEEMRALASYVQGLR